MDSPRHPQDGDDGEGKGGEESKGQDIKAKALIWTPKIEKRVTKKTPLQAHLRTVPVATPTGVESKMIYMPFTTTDLLNWQEKTPRLRDDVKKVHQRFSTIFLTYDPKWVDCMTLIETLLAPMSED